MGAAFDWDTYLREQNAEPAPPECFFQPDTAPENKFQIGMKLMIADPRGMTHLFAQLNHSQTTAELLPPALSLEEPRDIVKNAANVGKR